MKKLILTAMLLIIVTKAWGQAGSISNSDKENYMYAVKFINFRFRVTYSHTGNCFNLVNIYATHPDNTTTLLYTSSSGNISFNNRYFFVAKEIKNLRVYAKSIDERNVFLGSNDCDEEIIIDQNINNIVCCSPEYFQASAHHGGGEIDNEISITYNILPLHYLQSEANNTFLPTDDKVTLFDKPGFTASLYNYQYYFNGDWYNINSSLYNKDKLMVSAKDLFGDNCWQHIGKNILFRAVSCLGTSEPSYSESVTLTIKPSAPHIEDVTYVMPTCHNDEDAKLIIKFDRALYSDECGTNLSDQSFCEEHLFLTVNGITSNTPIDIDPTTLKYTLENLPAGAYILGLIDVIHYKKNGVTDTMYAYTMDSRHYYDTVIPDRLALKIESITADSVHCYGGADGKINIRMSGGTGVFTAFLKKSGEPADTLYSFNSNANVSFLNLSAGTYEVAVVDSNGCTADISGNDIKVTIEVKQPDEQVRITNSAVVEPLCFGMQNGSVKIYFRGGTPSASNPSYTVSWHKGGIAGLPILNPNPVVNEGGGAWSVVLDNVGTGYYGVRVTDSRYLQANPATEQNRCGCYDTLTVFVPEPPKLEVSMEEHHYVTCYGDSDGVLVAHATGGRRYSSGSPYRYEWSIVNGSISMPVPGAADSVLKDLPAGVYQVKVTDRNLVCTAQSIYKLAQPDTLVVKTEVQQHVQCSGENTGSIISKVTGGTPPYTYLWSNGATTPEIHGLYMGGYVVHVRDSRYADNGITGHYCSAHDEAFVTSPNGIEFNAVAADPSCFGYSDGSITLNVTGGVSPYSYMWEDGSTASFRTGLPSGAYYVSVTDGNGCIISQAYTLNDPDPIVVDLGKDITLCRNQTVKIDGRIDISGASYEWTNASGEVLSYLSEYELSAAGVYTLTATTPAGCYGSDEITAWQSDEEIDVDFVVPTTVAGNTKLYAINITRLSLDAIEWIIPDGAVLLEETTDRIELLFTGNGSYVLGLTGYKGLCEKTLYKTISVVDSKDIREDESSEPFLKRFIVAPNPSNGNFEAVIELREAAEYRLILYDMNGTVIETTPLYNNSSGIIPFSRSGSASGMYLLKFVSSQTTSVFKVLIH
ncbi:MAG: T9SS type A sorting domain-containing protein [Prevotellaceae bacterium]|jgi:hypothetical protein|nr:T9SS type A sorting domain-containing protein [Prevotellaceae bacterium]